MRVILPFKNVQVVSFLNYGLFSTVSLSPTKYNCATESVYLLFPLLFKKKAKSKCVEVTESVLSVFLYFKSRGDNRWVLCI